MSEQALLELLAVEKHFKDNNGQKFKALNGVSLSLYNNECIAIVGESGCGKSTIARLACKLIEADKGKLYFSGKDISKMKTRYHRDYYKQVQLIFQEPSNTFSKRMKIKQYMMEPLLNFKLMKKVDAYKYSVSMLESVGLNESFMDRYSGQLSGGELQRVTIARAIGLHPRIVVYDECTSALDVSIQKQIIDLIMDLKDKKEFSSIFITHDLALAENISDRVYVMYYGEIVEILTKKDIMSESRHPYTKYLIDSVLGVENKSEPIQLQDLSHKNDFGTNCCSYSPICKYATEECFCKKPVLSDGYGVVACFNPIEN